MTMNAIKSELRTRAHKLGFPLLGVALPELDPAHLTRVQTWIEAGYHAEMDYLTRRRDLTDGIRAVLPNVQAVIVLGLPYSQASSQQKHAFENHGRVSRYATGRDYHRIFEKRLKKLVNWLREQGDSPKSYVDYGPVLERAYAQAAGLGFIGKNNCLIHPEYGSYLFLAVILTTFPLPPDAPLPGDCGDCRRCLNACPTQALVAANQLDSRRCISYLTVEHKGEIPEELQERMGRWVLGCDACQMVCPYNQKAKSTSEPDFLKIRIPQFPALAEILKLDEPGFRERFSGTAAMRPKRAGLARNAAIAAGNVGNETLLPILEEVVESETDEMVSRHLQWALQRIRKRHQTNS